MSARSPRSAPILIRRRSVCPLTGLRWTARVGRDRSLPPRRMGRCCSCWPWNCGGLSCAFPSIRQIPAMWRRGRRQAFPVMPDPGCAVRGRVWPPGYACCSVTCRRGSGQCRDRPAAGIDASADDLREGDQVIPSQRDARCRHRRWLPALRAAWLDAIKALRQQVRRLCAGGRRGSCGWILNCGSHLRTCMLKSGHESKTFRSGGQSGSKNDPGAPRWRGAGDPAA